MATEHHRGGVSAAQVRKIKKPIIERRRRDRINESLNQLKALVLEALNKDACENLRVSILARISPSRRECGNVSVAPVAKRSRRSERPSRRRLPRHTSCLASLHSPFSDSFAFCAAHNGAPLRRVAVAAFSRSRPSGPSSVWPTTPPARPLRVRNQCAVLSGDVRL
ncbi:hypothetical protein LSAT2_023238 [Lamellibrachia satsuma]|nr:hypothetical protein LSAT2_023238 [Lamellibrachia satsuma]